MSNVVASSSRIAAETFSPDGNSWFHHTWGTKAPGVNITWKNLYVTCSAQQRNSSWYPWTRSRNREPDRIILNGVTGCAIPGTLLAIMGSSGAGKSTLLNCLACRNTSGLNVSGEILLNGSPLKKEHRNIIAYLQQHDLLFKSLTVREHLNFHARLRMDADATKTERKRRIDALLDELGLKNCEGTLIGDPSDEKSLSGGERKRLAFATEILTDPSVMFCDEPTTGLDSSMALSVVGMLYKLASKGKTIVCTIHQPPSDVFSLFDRLLLLAEGQTAYLGPLYEAIDFFSELGHVCPSTFNPADYYIHLLAIQPGHEEHDGKLANQVCESFKTSVYNLELLSLIDSIVRSSCFSYSHIQENDIGDVNRKSVSWYVQFCILLWRSLLNSFRNPSVLKISLAQRICVALMIGLCYFQTQMNQESITAIAGALFILITESTFPPMYGVLHEFPLELPVILRENQNGLYRIDAYYLSKLLSLTPGLLLEPIIFTALCYWMIGFHEDFGRFVLTAVILILTANAASACGCFFSAAFVNYSLAITILLPVDSLLLIVGGIFVRIASLPSSISWMQYFSWFRYSFEAAMITQWKGVSNLTCNDTPESQCLASGEQVLDYYGLREDFLACDVLMLGVVFACCHFLGFLALFARSFKN